MELTFAQLRKWKKSVRINNQHGSFEKMKSEAPQGSIVGPILFNLLINDFTCLTLSKKLQYYILQIITHCLPFPKQLQAFFIFYRRNLWNHQIVQRKSNNSECGHTSGSFNWQHKAITHERGSPHCMKNVRMRSYSTLYLVRMRENMDTFYLVSNRRTNHESNLFSWMTRHRNWW